MVDELHEVRSRAKDRLKGICTVNKVCDGASTRFCQGQKFGEPLGLGGVGKGLAFTANIEALNAIKLKTRLVTEHTEPDLEHVYFGHSVSLPIMPTSLSGVKASMGGPISELEFATRILKGAEQAGTIGWVGNTADDGQETNGIEAVKKTGGGIPIFKPQSNERLLELIKMAQEAGAIAVGVDLDGCGSTNWERAGKPVYRKSTKELNELADSTDLPFIAKGIMSIEDAMACVDAGVQGIDVSNHGGRVLDSTRGVAEVLPDIAVAVGGKVIITAGGGVRTGFDVLKLLALGAEGVLVGRPIVRAAIGGGADGVQAQFDYMRSELRRAMLMTSCKSVDDAGPQVLDR